MISGLTTSASRGRIYRAGWLIVALALVSYVLLAVAEQGTVGAGLREVPDDPLPFQRHQGAGLDLSRMSSLMALEWLEQVDAHNVTMILVPLDGDIVEAFNDPESFVAARSAVDSLLAAADGAPVAVCLRRPVSALEESVLAEAAVTAIIDEYSDAITYVSTCHADTSTSWQEHVLAVLNEDPPGSESTRILAPVSIGAPIRLHAPLFLNDLSDIYIDSLAGKLHVGLSLAEQAPLDTAAHALLQGIIHTRAHVGLVLASPFLDADPAAFVQSLTYPSQAIQELSEGFNGVTSPAFAWQGPWIPTQVGPVAYQRSIEPGSLVTAEFVGTEVWGVGIMSPEGGTIGIWIDAPDGDISAEPDAVIDLSRTQARDDSFLMVDGLPAARHHLTIVTANGDVALSGLFVTGRPEAGWHGVVGAVGIISLAVGGLAAVIAVAVDDLRLRIGLDRSGDEEVEHPRVFRREI